MFSLCESDVPVGHVLTVALRTSSCAGVSLADYIPTLQDNCGRRNDIIEQLFHLGLDSSEGEEILASSHSAYGKNVLAKNRQTKTGRQKSRQKSRQKT